MSYFDQIWKIIFEAEKARSLSEQYSNKDSGQGGEHIEDDEPVEPVEQNIDHGQGGEQDEYVSREAIRNEPNVESSVNKTNLKMHINLVKVTTVKEKLHLQIWAFYFKDPFEIDCYPSNMEEFANRFIIAELYWHSKTVPDTFINCNKLTIEFDELTWPLDILCAYLSAQEVHIWLPLVVQKNYKMIKTAEFVRVFIATGAKKVTVRLPICFLDSRTHSYERFITDEKLEQFDGPYKMILRRNFLDIIK